MLPTTLAEPHRDCGVSGQVGREKRLSPGGGAGGGGEEGDGEEETDRLTWHHEALDLDLEPDAAPGIVSFGSQ